MRVMRKYLSPDLFGIDEESFTTSLCQLFSDIDVDSNGNMEWDELTNFLIDAGMNLKDISRVDRIDEVRLHSYDYYYNRNDVLIIAIIDIIVLFITTAVV